MQTRRHSNKQYAKGRGGPRWRISPDRWREILADRETASMARPSPVYPTDPRPGDHIGYVEWMIRGVLTRIELHQPKSVTPARCRCDTLEARQDGLALIVGGLNAVNRFAAQRLIPRPMSRRTIAGLRDDDPWAP